MCSSKKEAAAVTAEPRVYHTSYCNHGHRLSDGAPVGHECNVLPPASLQAEREGDMAKAIELIEEARPLRRHKGTRERPRGRHC